MKKGTRQAELVAWLSEAGQEVDRGLSWLVANNPKGCYNLIQGLYPGKFRLITSGLETSETVQKEMYQFLTRRAEMSGNAVIYVQSIIKRVGYNPTAINWTKVI